SSRAFARGMPGDSRTSAVPRQAAKCLSVWLMQEPALCPGFCRLLVLSIIDQIVHDSGVSQRRRVAEVAVFVFGNLAEDSPHYLAGACLRQSRCELNQVGRRNRTNLLAHPSDELFAKLFARFFAGHQRHVGVYALTLDVVRIANDGGL